MDLVGQVISEAQGSTRAGMDKGGGGCDLKGQQRQKGGRRLGGKGNEGGQMRLCRGGVSGDEAKALEMT